jgi:hypothetical protein
MKDEKGTSPGSSLTPLLATGSSMTPLSQSFILPLSSFPEDG